jgi:ABC-type transport system involved in multi-copper enzyme maturation permease subunit
MLNPIFSIANTTVREAIRRKVLLIILLVGVVFLVIAPGLGALSARSETTVLRGLLLGVIQITSAVIAIVLTVYMIPNEIERRTIYTILSKPVQRWQFLIGKYLGAVSALAMMMFLMSFIMVFTFYLQQGQNATAALDLLKAPAMYFVQMSLLAAVAIFFSTFVSPIVNFFLSGGLYLLGSLFAPFFQTLEESQGTPAATKLFAKFINVILPNFANYNVQNPIINPGQVIQNEQQYFLQNTLYGLVYIAALILGGILVFDRREV